MGSPLRQLRVYSGRPTNPGAMAVQGGGEVAVGERSGGTALSVTYASYHMEMLLCRSTLEAVAGGPIAWLQHEPDEGRRLWRAQGFDNTLFPGGTMPFKAVLTRPDGEVVHNVAAKYYALAHRKEFVEGPPVALVSISVPPDTFYRVLLKGHVVVRSDQLTVGFRKPLTSEYFPGILGPEVHMLEGSLGTVVFFKGRALLNSRDSF